MVDSGLNVVHNTLVGGQDDVTELSGWKDLVNKLLEVLELKVEPWGDDTTLVESSVQINDNLAISRIINDLKSVDVSVLLHHSKELDDNLRDWSDQNLYISKGVRNHSTDIFKNIHLLSAVGA